MDTDRRQGSASGLAPDEPQVVCRERFRTWPTGSAQLHQEEPPSSRLAPGPWIGSSSTRCATTTTTPRPARPTRHARRLTKLPRAVRPRSLRDLRALRHLPHAPVVAYAGAAPPSYVATSSQARAVRRASSLLPPTRFPRVFDTPVYSGIDRRPHPNVGLEHLVSEPNEPALLERWHEQH